MHTRIADVAAARLRNRVEFVEEENAWGGGTGLVKNVAHVRLRLAEPHCQQLRPFDRDEVGLALTGDRLRQQRLSASGRPIEEDAARRFHAELEELVRMLHRVLEW